VRKQAKNKKEVKALVNGAPDIAHPSDKEKYERQLSFIQAWFFEMFERFEGNDLGAAQEARAELQTFLLNSLGQLLRVAQNDKDSIDKQWACKLLADIFVSIGKRVGKVRIKKPYGKLMEIEAFRDEKKRIGKVRTDTLFPEMVRAITQHELIKAWHFRKWLLLLNGEPASAAWRAAAKRKNIPELYWPTVKLPEFLVKYEPEWWNFLWPLIEENSNHQLLLAKAQEKFKPFRKRSFADLQKTAHDHLKALARHRDHGAFYFF
jgi:hypothetical protein